MTFNEYQKAAYETALPRAKNITYMMFGLANESGETLGKMKKVLRGDISLTDATPALKAELGDVFWYLAGCAEQLGLTLQEIAEENIKKLQDRQLRGKIQGDGDTR